MKTKHLFLFIIASFAMFVSCKDDHAPDTTATVTAALSVEPEVITVANKSGKCTINLISNVSWKITQISESWCTSDIRNGSGNQTVELSLDANLTDVERNVIITFQTTAGVNEAVSKARQPP